ncbi:hypothetical protein AB4305_04465 [Nocardia sp. 2YAB30]
MTSRLELQRRALRSRRLNADSWVSVLVSLEREEMSTMMTMDQMMAMARDWLNQMFPGMPMMM